MELQVLFLSRDQVQNAEMTIAYPDGTTLEAIVLSHDEHEIRAIATGSEDVMVFTRVKDAWLSENLQPVAIEFAWQRHRVAPVYSDKDFVCSKELASRIFAALFDGAEPD